MMFTVDAQVQKVESTKSGKLGVYEYDASCHISCFNKSVKENEKQLCRCILEQCLEEKGTNLCSKDVKDRLLDLGWRIFVDDLRVKRTLLPKKQKDENKDGPAEPEC